MKVNISDVNELRKEFEDIQVGFNSLHDDMQMYLDGYESNFFYAPKPNMPQNTKIGVNLVQMFADKLWFHTSEFPRINVPSTPDQGEQADMREKIVMAAHEKNGMDLLWGDFTFDGSIMAACVARTVFNVDTRCPEITRHDPRRCYWQKADSGDGAVLVFWTATPMTRTAITKKYGVTPTSSDGMVYDLLADYGEVPLDNEDYFLVITRDDADTSTEFVGKQFLKKPYKHLQGGIPVDVAMPYKIATFNKTPKFYLSKIKELQAEFNELWRRRANVVRKLGNPLVYGRGIYKSNEQDVKAQMAMDGGFVSLKENGDLALLTIPETKMIDTALQDCFQRMKDAAGFPTATFGEVVGANTSGDALGMYFTPTQKMINHYNKSYKAFLQGINAKILRGYDKFGKINEQFTLNGFMPHSSMRSIEGKKTYEKGQGFSVTFTKDVIAGNYVTVVTPAAVTPKDDIAYKRFILDGVTNKFFSRQYGLDEIGVLSPEDEFKRLQAEQADPMLNPEGATALKQFDPTAGVMDENGQNPFQPQGEVPTPGQVLSGV
jgi:hypothetical protein